MNYLIQKGKIRSQVINVPEGLPELLSDITREVLRCQPTTECLCQFIIDYLHSLIVTRDKARMAKAVIDRALRTVDAAIADVCICNIDKVKADQMSIAMEECFKRFLAQRRCEKGKTTELLKFNEFDMLDELMQKCKFSETELKTSRPVIEAAYQRFVDAYMRAQENTEGTEALYQYFRDREMKRVEKRLQEEAAVKIQANFRGFLVRRSMFSNKATEKPIEKPVEEISVLSENVADMDVAARKIQRFFRNHMSVVRKQAENAMELARTLQDVCKPESEMSLTAHPAVIGIPDIKQEMADEAPHSYEEAHELEAVVQTYEELKDKESFHTEISTNHHDEEEDVKIFTTTIETIEVHQEILVDGEVLEKHDDSHTATNGEHDPNEILAE